MPRLAVLCAPSARLALFVLALRHLGTASTGAHFSTAPFLGAALSIPLLGEQPTVRLAHKRLRHAHPRAPDMHHQHRH